MNIADILGNDYLKKFRVFHDQSLFEPDWDMLKKHRCPICSSKLHQPRASKYMMCTSKKHKRPFLISAKKLEAFCG